MVNIFLTSLQRKSGKTFVSAGLAATLQSLGFCTCVYKPIQITGIEKNGFMQSPDLTYVKSMDPYINTHFTYLFKSGSEPQLAAEYENVIIDTDYINHEFQNLCGASDCTIIDGEGGLLSPIGIYQTNADLIKKLQVPIVLVTKPTEDSINTTLAGIYAASEKGLNVRGVIINNIEKSCSKTLLTEISRIIEEYSDVKILGLVPHIKDTYCPQDVIMANLNGIDIESVFNIKIEKLDLN